MDTFPPSDLCLYKGKESSVHGTISSVVVKTLSRLYYGCTVDLFPPDLCLYECKEFSVHGTISSVAFQKIIITAVLETRPSPLYLCPYKCKELEFRVSSKLFTGMIMEKENICIPDGIKNAGLSLHFIGV